MKKAESDVGGEGPVELEDADPYVVDRGDSRLKGGIGAGIRLPEPRLHPTGRVKITVEVDAELGESFKEWCRVEGYQQRDVIQAALERLREQHGW